MDIYTLIFIALAVFILLRLRSVLGTKTGHERDTFHRPPPPGPVSESPTDKVVPMPGRAAPPVIDQQPAAPEGPRWGAAYPPGSPLANAFDAIGDRDPSFAPDTFTHGARMAYEMIVMAFANGDRRALKDLLAPDVFEGFEGVIREREANQEKVETRFIGIDKAEIVDAQLRDSTAQLTMRFQSQLVTATRDRAGTVIDGSPDKVVSVTDVWTFARDTRNRDPNWKLVATETAH